MCDDARIPSAPSTGAIRIGVTGTDTGVGKTVVAAALVAMLRGRGWRVAGMKPVETGVRPDDTASDAVTLREAAGGDDPIELVCPVMLEDPLAPWVAARLAGREISLDQLDGALEALGRGRDTVVIEGVGGLLVPLTRDIWFDALFRRWGAGVIVVALDRLGVINHTLLTVRAARAAGLAVHGVVLNAGCEPGDTSRQTNRDTLAALLPDTPVITFPPVEHTRNWSALAAAAENAGLDALLPTALRRPAESLDA